jgi:hypothetical protein
MIADNND